MFSCEFTLHVENHDTASSFFSLFFYRSSSLSPAHSRPRSDPSRLCTAPATSSVCCSSKQEEPSGENRQGEHLSTRRRRRRPIWGVCQDREEQEWQEEARVEHTEVETRLTCSYTWRSLLDVVLWVLKSYHLHLLDWRLWVITLCCITPSEKLTKETHREIN